MDKTAAELAYEKYFLEKYRDNLEGDYHPTIHFFAGWDARDAEMAKLQAENQRLREALEKARNELGVPQPGYLAPVANAANIIKEALRPEEKAE